VKPEFIIDLCQQHQGEYKNFVDEYKTKHDEINDEKRVYLEEYDEPSVNFYTNPELLIPGK
jgi:hypothetical protein